VFHTEPPRVIVRRRRTPEVRRYSGTWKVAYADFVTAMMSFFMVMWILGLSDQDKMTISGYFNDPMGYSRTQPLTRNIVRFPGAAVTQGRVDTSKPDIVGKEQKDIVLVGHRISAAIKKDELIGNPYLHQPAEVENVMKYVQVVSEKDGLLL
jgi:hypothetical protein